MGYVEPDFALLEMNLATLADTAAPMRRCLAPDQAGCRRKMAAQLLAMACMQRHLLRWLQPMPAAKHAGQARHTSYPSTDSARRRVCCTRAE
jgi:hypothetical protein